MAAAWLRLARVECLGRARRRLWKGKEQAAARRGLSRPTEEQVKQWAFPVPQSQPFFRLFARQAQVRHHLVSRRKQAQLAALVLWAFQPLAAAQQKPLLPGDARALTPGQTGGFKCWRAGRRPWEGEECGKWRTTYRRWTASP